MSFKTITSLWLRWLKRFLFKSKNILPESPSQEITTSSKGDIIVETFTGEVKAKQEQMKFFEKANDLREAQFDLNPVWNNHDFIPMKGQYEPQEEDEYSAEIKEVKGIEPRYKDEVLDYSNPWRDLPAKNYQLNQKELQSLKPKDDGNNNTNA